MRLVRQTVIVIGFVLLMLPVAISTPSTPLRAVEFDIEYVLKPHRTGPTILNLTIKPNRSNGDRRNITVKVSIIGKLIYHGDNEWREPLDDTNGVKRRIELAISPDDTSGIKFDYLLEDGRGPIGGTAAYFVAEGDSVKYFDSDPRAFIRPELPFEDRPPTGRRVKGEFPHSDSLYPIPEDTLQLPRHKVLKMTQSEKEHSIQYLLEEYPETLQVQYIVVDSQTLVRRKGEQKFYPVTPRFSTQGMTRKPYDSAIDPKGNTLVDEAIDLRRPEDLEYARSIISSLQATDTVGIYRAQITRNTMVKLTKRGIKFRRWGSTRKEDFSRGRKTQEKLEKSYLLLPTLYGIGTGLPVIVFGVIIALGAHSIGKIFTRVTQVEKWLRWVTGVVFIGVGVYYCLIYYFGVEM